MNLFQRKYNSLQSNKIMKLNSLIIQYNNAEKCMISSIIQPDLEESKMIIVVKKTIRKKLITGFRQKLLDGENA